jgi:hypothetical protein
MPVLLHLVLVMTLAAGLMFSPPTASGGCPGCECVVACGPASLPPIPVAPIQPSFHVEQGPTYNAVIIAEEDVERRLKFLHPHYFPYIRHHHGATFPLER